jgi:hypothetical protein
MGITLGILQEATELIEECYENKVLETTFGTNREERTRKLRKSHSEEFHNTFRQIFFGKL